MGTEMHTLPGDITYVGAVPTRKRPQLTKLEWFKVRCNRGVEMTGHPYHSVELDGQPWVYYWPVEPHPQPVVTWLRTYGAKCPIEAAGRFLARYEKGNFGSTTTPKQRSTD